MGETKLKSVSPTDQTVAEAQKTVTVTDAQGRVIELRKPPFTWQWELPDCIPGDLGPQQLVIKMGMALPLGYVVSIDGDPVMRPKSELALKALWTRLDEHGYQAVIEGVKEHFDAGVATEAAAKN